MAIFITYRNTHFKVVVAGTFISSFYGRTVTKISTHSQSHMQVVHKTIIGRIKAQPAIVGNKGFNPGMGGAFTSHTIAVWTNIPTYIAGRYTYHPQHDQ